jgi:hypothetical protein
MLTIIHSIRSGGNGIDYPERPAETFSPRASFLTPQVSPTTTLNLTLNDGSIEESQIDLNSLRITIDGSGSGFEIKARSFDGEGDVFELLELDLVPSSSWAVGDHVVRVIVHDGYSNETDQQFTFHVTGNGESAMPLLAPLLQ